MVKKKSVEVKETTTPKLSPEMYWEWRCTINEMNLAKKEFDVNYLKHEIMIKDLEISRLKSSLFKNTLVTLQDKVSLAKTEYENMKKRIEDTIKISLNGCMIDDISHEVKKLDEDVKS